MYGDALSGGDWARLKAVSERLEIYTRGVWLREFGNPLGSCDEKSLEIHLEAGIVLVQRYTWRQWLSNCRDSLVGHDRARWRSTSSAKNISVRAEWLRPSGRAPSEPSETSRWRVTPRPASIPRVALHIALRSLFHHCFLLCRSPIINERTGVVANCDHTSEWVHWVHACIGIAMRWVTLRKSLLAFLLPARKMQFSLY